MSNNDRTAKDDILSRETREPTNFWGGFQARWLPFSRGEKPLLFIMVFSNDTKSDGETMNRVDARGLCCPAPVLAVKATVETHHPGRVEVLVDNEPAQENVIRFLDSQGYTTEVKKDGRHSCLGGKRTDRAGLRHLPGPLQLTGTQAGWPDHQHVGHRHRHAAGRQGDQYLKQPCSPFAHCAASD